MSAAEEPASPDFRGTASDPPSPPAQLQGAGGPVAPVPPVPPSADRRRVPPTGRYRWLELPVLVVVAVAIAIVLKTFVVQPFFIPSESMEPTLHGCTGCQGDRIVTNKLIYDLRSVHAGDIIVFQDPATWNDEPPATESSNPVSKAVLWAGRLVGLVPPSTRDLVKRVIATGGESVKCCDSAGRIQIRPAGSSTWISITEPYVTDPLPMNAPGTNSGRTFKAVTIPQGRLWVMGDNRADSADSLFHYRANNNDINDSTIPESSVVGKATAIVWPIGRWRTLGTPAGFTAAGIPAGPPADAWRAGSILAAVVVVLAVLVGLPARRRRRRRRAARPPG